MSEAKPQQTYLGDGVFAHRDGYHVALTTYGGGEQTIFLDPHVQDALMTYIEKRRTQERAPDSADESSVAPV